MSKRYMKTIKTKEQLQEAIANAYGVLYIVNGNDMLDGDFEEYFDWDDYLDEIVRVTKKNIEESDRLPYRVHRFKEYLNKDEWKHTKFYLLEHNTPYNEENQDVVFAITSHF